MLQGMSTYDCHQLLDQPIFTSGGGFCSLSSAFIKKMMDTPDRFDTHLRRAISFYKDNADFMYSKLRERFVDDTILHFTKPTGGYFLWVKIQHEKLTENLLLLEQKLEEKKIKVLFGKGCSVNFEKNFRLCFSYLNTSQIERGIEIIDEVIQGILL